MSALTNWEHSFIGKGTQLSMSESLSFVYLNILLINRYLYNKLALSVVPFLLIYKSQSLRFICFDDVTMDNSIEKLSLPPHSYGRDCRE